LNCLKTVIVVSNAVRNINFYPRYSVLSYQVGDLRMKPLRSTSRFYNPFPWAQLSYFATDSQSVRPSVRLGLELLCDSWQNFSWRGWYHGASSLAGGRVLSPSLDPLPESSSLDLLLGLLCSTLYWSLLHLTLWNLLCSTIYWSLLVWVNPSLSCVSSVSVSLMHILMLCSVSVP
jgi:hypothetical protein